MQKGPFQRGPTVHARRWIMEAENVTVVIAGAKPITAAHAPASPSATGTSGRPEMSNRPIMVAITEAETMGFTPIKASKNRVALSNTTIIQGCPK